MAAFRRCMPALVVFALLLGAAYTTPAYAQAFSCVANAGVPPILRAEGLTELTGDIVLNCSGVVQTPPPGASSTANIQVFLNTNVTSRLLNSSSSSEATLLIGEPTAGLVVCQETTGGPNGGACPAGTNAVQGVQQGNNSVVFLGVPVGPPGSNITQVFRITNIRANASGVAPASGGIPGQVIAFVSASGSSSIPINNQTGLIVGFVQNGLGFSVRKASDVTSTTSGPALQQCVKQDKVQEVFLRFGENFATSFKVRGTTTQSTPGAIYNTESGFTSASLPGNAGYADFGTRLRAVFNNIPAGATLYVGLSNINNGCVPNGAPGSGGSCPTASGGGPGPVTPPVAVLTLTETGGFFQATPSNTSDFKLASGGAVVQVAALTPVNGSATAVWEIISANPLAIENVDIPVWLSYAANPGSNSPALGTANVIGTFAPISTTTTASQSAPVPRFTDTGAKSNPFLSISACVSNILFPFVTNQAGFDTGLAIANTTTDPFGTTPQAGTCTLNFYGANAPAAITSASVASGTVYTALASTSSPNFQGYVIAVCNFQFGHGFAFISDLGARNLAMGYLALVVPTGADNSRGEGNAGLEN